MVSFAEEDQETMLRILEAPQVNFRGIFEGFQVAYPVIQTLSIILKI